MRKVFSWSAQYLSCLCDLLVIGFHEFRWISNKLWIFWKRCTHAFVCLVDIFDRVNINIRRIRLLQFFKIDGWIIKTGRVNWSMFTHWLGLIGCSKWYTVLIRRTKWTKSFIMMYNSIWLCQFVETPFELGFTYFSHRPWTMGNMIMLDRSILKW